MALHYLTRIGRKLPVLTGHPLTTSHYGRRSRHGTHAVHLHRRGRAATGLVHRGAERPMKRLPVPLGIATRLAFLRTVSARGVEMALLRQHRPARLRARSCSRAGLHAQFWCGPGLSRSAGWRDGGVLAEEADEFALASGPRGSV